MGSCLPGQGQGCQIRTRHHLHTRCVGVDVAEVVDTAAGVAAGAEAGIPVVHSIPHRWSPRAAAVIAAVAAAVVAAAVVAVASTALASTTVASTSVAPKAACRNLPAAHDRPVMEARSHMDVELARTQASAVEPAVAPVVAGRTAVEAERRQAARHQAHRTNCRCLVGLAQGDERRRHRVLAAAVVGTALADTGLARKAAAALAVVRALAVPA